MTYLARRMREIREEESVPGEVRAAMRRGETVQFLGRAIDPVAAWRISSVWPWVETISYRGRGG
jgi:hypothetical protein